MEVILPFSFVSGLCITREMRCNMGHIALDSVIGDMRLDNYFGIDWVLRMLDLSWFRDDFLVMSVASTPESLKNFIINCKSVTGKKRYPAKYARNVGGLGHQELGQLLIMEYGRTAQFFWVKLIFGIRWKVWLQLSFDLHSIWFSGHSFQLLLPLFCLVIASSSRWEWPDVYPFVISDGVVEEWVYSISWWIELTLIKTLKSVESLKEAMWLFPHWNFWQTYVT